jgi:hypothetical protein
LDSKIFQKVNPMYNAKMTPPAIKKPIFMLFFFV